MIKLMDHPLTLYIVGMLKSYYYYFLIIHYLTCVSEISGLFKNLCSLIMLWNKSKIILNVCFFEVTRGLYFLLRYVIILDE